MKKTFFIIILILALGLGIYFVLNKTKQPLTTFINTNSNSNIAMVIKAENGEGLVAFTDENKIIDKITIHTADKKIALIQLNELGLPARLDFKGTTATFNNYTDTTVDIAVKRADGTNEIFQKSAISPQALSFIPVAMAYSVSEYMSGAGTAFNVVTCGVGLGSILFSGGATSPFAYLGCASLATRIVTLDTEIDSCKGDVLDCAKDAILGSIISEVEKNGPDFLKSGFRLKGSLKNSVTGLTITKGVILIENNSNGKGSRGEWMTNSYEIYLKNAGVYSAQLSAEGFADSNFDMILTPTKAQIRIPGEKTALEKDFGGEDYAELEVDFFVDPDAFIRGEIIDAKEGMPIENAKISLLEGAVIVDEAMTESNGEFTVQPPLHEKGQNFVLKIVTDKYAPYTKDIYINYDVRPESDEYEIEDWNGVVKLTTGDERWGIDFTPTADPLSLKCPLLPTLKAFSKNNTFWFTLDENGKPDGAYKTINAKGLEGNVKNGKSYLVLPTYLDVTVQLNGDFNDNFKGGDWNVFFDNSIYPNNNPKRQELLNACGGSWIATRK